MSIEKLTLRINDMPYSQGNGAIADLSFAFILYLQHQYKSIGNQETNFDDIFADFKKWFIYKLWEMHETERGLFEEFYEQQENLNPNLQTEIFQAVATHFQKGDHSCRNPNDVSALEKAGLTSTHNKDYPSFGSLQNLVDEACEVLELPKTILSSRERTLG